jgi:hypothetical protein
MTVEISEPVAQRTDSPYPGPRPFHPAESKLFFGRERETSELRSLVLSNSLVLLYAQSGAGKTSLLQAGLIPALSERGVSVLPVLRIGPPGIEGPGAAIENPYVRSLAVNWATSEDHALEAVTNLRSFLELVANRYEAPADVPRILIIDQFEELFTVCAELWPSRSDLFAQLDAALASDAELRVVLSMREDYVAQLDPYAGLVSNRLQQRYRIETLRREQALAAVSCPLTETERKFAPGAAEYLVDQLLQIRIDRNGRVEQVGGEYVEPVHLQVVCQRLWADLPSRVTSITEQDLRAFGDVDQVLGNFYTSAIRDAAKAGRVREPKLRSWVESVLVTSVETRGTVHRQAAVQAGIPQAALNHLVDDHLVRAEPRAGSEWYELTHDRLIGPIQLSNARYREDAAHKRLRRLGELLGVLVILGAVGIAAVALSGSTQKSASANQSSIAPLSGTPIPPTITVPAQDALYHLNSVYRTSYTCHTPSVSCTGTTTAGALLRTDRAGRHTFIVTATNQASHISTTRSVTYTIVPFAATVYPGHAFAIYYPSGWHIADAEKRQPGYTDTTIVSQSDPHTLIRVDVSPKPLVDPRVAAAAVMRFFAGEPTYHLIGTRRTVFKGMQLFRWDFTVQESGQVLRKEDDFLRGPRDGKNFAILTQAPAARFQAVAPQFAALRNSFVAK